MLQRPFLNGDKSKVIVPLILNQWAAFGPPGGRSIDNLHPQGILEVPAEQLGARVHKIFMLVLSQPKNIHMTRDTAPAMYKYILARVGPADFVPSLAVMCAHKSAPTCIADQAHHGSQ